MIIDLKDFVRELQIFAKYFVRETETIGDVNYKICREVAAISKGNLNNVEKALAFSIRYLNKAEK